MAKVYIVTDVEMEALISSLELSKLRQTDRLPTHDPDRQKLEDMHRSFHFHVVNWVQKMGHRGFS